MNRIEPVRTFIGVPVSVNRVLSQILDEFHDCLRGDKIKWADYSIMHVTLLFLGDTEQEEVLKISNRFSEEVEFLKKRRTAIEGIGTFGRKRDPRVIWMGLGGEDFFSGLKNYVEHLLDDLVVHVDKRTFQPHVTLGRIKKINNYTYFSEIVEKYNKLVRGETLIDRIIFYKSELLKEGPVYTPIKTIMLH